MSSYTKMALLEAALAARGEQMAEQLAGARKWTRNFLGARVEGKLVPVSGVLWWFVGSNGALRVGATRRTSKRVKEEVKRAMFDEGQIALDERIEAAARFNKYERSHSNLTFEDWQKRFWDYALPAPGARS